MAKLILSGSTSGSVTLESPAVSGTTTLTLPTTSGTIALSGGAVSGTTGSFSGDLSFNSGYGSAAVAYGCRAWVNFNGTGTVAIRESGNVSSITDNGTGDYTVNFTNAMPDGNYVLSGTAIYPSSINDHFVSLGDNNGAGGTLPGTTAVRFRTMYNSAANTPQDCTYVTIMIVR